MPRRKNIYFGKNSVFNAVKDVGKKGCNSKKEVIALAIAQALDFLDGVTKNKDGKIVKFTIQRWNGRTRILRILARRYGGLRVVNQIDKLIKKYHKGKISKTKVREELRKIAKRYKVSRLIRRWRI